MRKLRILLVLQTQFADSFGVGKVHFDLKKEYERLGHQVDTLSWNDLYPKGEPYLSKFFGPLITDKTHRKLKKIAHQYDIIDANYQCIPFSKETFGFKGVLLFRSHGLPPVYRIAEQTLPFKQIMDDLINNIKFKTRIGNIYRAMQLKVGDKELFLSIDNADIVHCLNFEEYEYLLKYGIAKEKIVLLPNGLADDYIENANKVSSIKKENIITFLGSWTLRKGITDMNRIINEIKDATNITKFQIFGGGQKEDVVQTRFDVSNYALLDVVSHYKQNELVKLIKNTKVGIFPSYIEGFGLAVVEQLACGIPVVAYKVPGPSDILSEIDSSLLIEPGDKEAFSKKVVEILNMSDIDYETLSEKCKARSQDFLISNIAQQFVGIYQHHLTNL